MGDDSHSPGALPIPISRLRPPARVPSLSPPLPYAQSPQPSPVSVLPCHHLKSCSSVAESRHQASWRPERGAGGRRGYPGGEAGIGGCFQGWKLQVVSPFKSTHSFWISSAVQMTRKVCWGNWSLRESVGRSQIWEHRVKERPGCITFLAVPPQPCPSPTLCPTNPGIPRRSWAGSCHLGSSTQQPGVTHQP